MNSSIQRDQSALLVLKVWLEECEGGRVEWRGEVLDVDSNRIISFEDWPEMVALIADTLAAQPARAIQAHHD